MGGLSSKVKAEMTRSDSLKILRREGSRRRRAEESDRFVSAARGYDVGACDIVTDLE